MYVVYSKPKSKWAIVGHAIRFFTKKKGQNFDDVPSHMQFVFGKRFSLEAVGGNGVRVGFFPNSIRYNEILAVFNYSKLEIAGYKDGHLLTEGAFKYHGAEYDYLSILWFAFYIIRKWLFNIPVPSRNKWDNQKRFFCSEMMEFIEEGDHGHIDPNTQMLSLVENEDFELIFVRSRNGDFDKWFEPEMEELRKMGRN